MKPDVKKQGIILVIAAFIFLFAFSIVFYFERLNSDAGYYFFHAVNKANFHVEHHRLVLIPAELLVVAGSNLHLPLKLLAILYSLSHVLFAGILAALCIKLFRDINAALLITTLQFAGLKYAVFTPQFELFYGLDLLVFAMAYLSYFEARESKWDIKNIAIISLLLTFIFTSHPMAIYCYFAGIFIYKPVKNLKHVLILSISFLVLYVAFKTISISEYEKSKFTNFNNAFNSDFINHYLSFSFLKNGFLFLVKYYSDVLIIFLFGIYFYIKNRQYQSLLINILFFKGVLITIWIMFEPDTLGRYIEQVYFPFVFVACLWLYRCAVNRSTLLFLALMIGYRIILIIEISKSYVERSNQIARFTAMAQNQPGNKFFVTKHEMGEKLYQQGNWSYGLETMIHSSIHFPKTVTITKDEDLTFNDNLNKLKSSDFLFRPFDIIPSNNLNKYYFKLTDGDYKLLRTE